MTNFIYRVGEKHEDWISMENPGRIPLTRDFICSMVILRGKTTPFGYIIQKILNNHNPLMKTWSTMTLSLTSVQFTTSKVVRASSQNWKTVRAIYGWWALEVSVSCSTQ